MRRTSSYKYTYDPAKSRELLKKAGYPNGVAVDFYATIGRYTLDKQICEAIAQMLNRAGFKVTLKTPEWSTLWANVQKGGVPFYYMGRGSIIDPSVMMQQYFGTGGSPRIGYSNPELDKLLVKERETFDHEARMKVLAAGDGGDQRRGAGDFPLAAPDGLGPRQVDRFPTGGYWRYVGLDDQGSR